MFGLIMIIILVFAIYGIREQKWQNEYRQAGYMRKLKEESQPIEHMQQARRSNEMANKRRKAEGSPLSDMGLGCMNTMPSIETFDKIADKLPSNLASELRTNARAEARAAGHYGGGKRDTHNTYGEIRNNLEQTMEKVNKHKGKK